MGYAIRIKILGYLLLLESALMLPALGIAFYDKSHDMKPFLVTIFITAILGFVLSKISKGGDENITTKDGLAIVVLGWIFLSLFGALPLYLSKGVPTYIDAFFETVSGFTTTGATIIKDVEALPRGLLFWRSFSHWIGGMGILVFTISLLPALGIGGFQIFKAESPGPVAGKIAPRIKDTAKILYTIYFSITVIQVIMLLFGGMNLFDSLVHTFGTVGTGGFGIKGNSIGYYNSSYINMVIGFFMMFSGVNFSLYYLAYQGRWRDALKDEELRLYLKIIIIATIAIAINLFMTNYGGIKKALEDAFFQVSSIITTTGYSTADFDLWPNFSRSIIVLLMFIGGCAGSTAGGIKIIRHLVLFKTVRREIVKLFHPRAIRPIKVNGKAMAEETVQGINAFMALYFLIFGISVVLITLEGLDLVSAFTSIATTFGNVGPGLNLVGPANNFSDFSLISKLYLSVLMLLGRLELWTIIALSVPRNLVQ